MIAFRTVITCWRNVCELIITALYSLVPQAMPSNRFKLINGSWNGYDNTYAMNLPEPPPHSSFLYVFKQEYCPYSPSGSENAVQCSRTQHWTLASDIFALMSDYRANKIGWLKLVQYKNRSLPLPYCQKETPPLQSFVSVTVPVYWRECLGSASAFRPDTRHTKTYLRPMIHAFLTRVWNKSSCLDRRQGMNDSNSENYRAERKKIFHLVELSASGRACWKNEYSKLRLILWKRWRYRSCWCGFIKYFWPRAKILREYWIHCEISCSGFPLL